MDVLTGEARHSLSEEKLLRQHLDVKVGVVSVSSGSVKVGVACVSGVSGRGFGMG